MKTLHLLVLGIMFALIVKDARAAGFQHIMVPDPVDKPLSVGIWYPSKSPVHESPDSPLGQLLAVGGDVSGKQLPLIVISHGNGGIFTSHADTALALAEAGFVVAAVTHTGDNADDDSSPASRWMLDRPRHVHLLIDYMLAKWPAHARIDATRIGVFGFSAGGYTALVLIGGIPDAKRAVAHCAANPDELVCQLGDTRDFDNPKIAAALASKGNRDARIGAAVIAAPGFGFAFDPDSLARVAIPVQLWAAAEDRNVPYTSNTVIIRASLGTPPDFHDIAGAGHYSFLPACPARLAALPIGAKICTDSPGFDRVAFHQEFNKDVVDFFSAHLERRIK
jgi:predicted dienelactone hydrolase